MTCQEAASVNLRLGGKQKHLHTHTLPEALLCLGFVFQQVVISGSLSPPFPCFILRGTNSVVMPAEFECTINISGGKGESVNL